MPVNTRMEKHTRPNHARPQNRTVLHAQRAAAPAPASAERLARVEARHRPRRARRVGLHAGAGAAGLAGRAVVGGPAAGRRYGHRLSHAPPAQAHAGGPAARHRHGAHAASAHRHRRAGRRGRPLFPGGAVSGGTGVPDAAGDGRPLRRRLPLLRPDQAGPHAAGRTDRAAGAGLHGVQHGRHGRLAAAQRAGVVGGVEPARRAVGALRAGAYSPGPWSRTQRRVARGGACASH